MTSKAEVVFEKLGLSWGNVSKALTSRSQLMNNLSPLAEGAMLSKTIKQKANILSLARQKASWLKGDLMNAKNTKKIKNIAKDLDETNKIIYGLTD